MWLQACSSCTGFYFLSSVAVPHLLAMWDSEHFLLPVLKSLQMLNLICSLLHVVPLVRMNQNCCWHPRKLNFAARLLFISDCACSLFVYDMMCRYFMMSVRKQINRCLVSECVNAVWVAMIISKSGWDTFRLFESMGHQGRKYTADSAVM